LEPHDIERYLAELGTELSSRGIKKPVRMMLIGGAYMLLLANAPRTTHDIDIFWLEEGALQQILNPLRDSVQAITNRHELAPDWFNYLTQLLMQDEVIVPNGKLWKRFGPLYIYVPPKKYILALKILAGRTKDLDDCAILLSQIKIKTRQQAEKLLEEYVLPEAREKNAEQIEHSLNELFKKM
jgi:hypothetical protein